MAPGARARLESTVGLLRSLAVTGASGLEAAREQRLAAITAAEQLGDPELTARVIGGYDVPAIWTRSDDPEQAAQIVAAAERTLAALPPGRDDASRARLLATIAVESRGTHSARAARGRRRKRSGSHAAWTTRPCWPSPSTACSCRPSTGPASPRERDRIGAELVALSARHGLVTFEILGHLIRLQARSALADFAGADEHATAADRLAERHERPLVAVFTRVVPGAAAGRDRRRLRRPPRPPIGTPPRELDGAGMPGRRARPAAAGPAVPARVARATRPTSTTTPTGARTSRGHVRWCCWRSDRPRRRCGGAAPAPRTRPRDLLFEALWCLTGRAAITLGDRAMMTRAHTELTPAANELAGAGSGMLTVGPVARHLDDLAAALGR